MSLLTESATRCGDDADDRRSLGVRGKMGISTAVSVAIFLAYFSISERYQITGLSDRLVGNGFPEGFD